MCVLPAASSALRQHLQIRRVLRGQEWGQPRSACGNKTRGFGWGGLGWAGLVQSQTMARAGHRWLGSFLRLLL